MEQRSLFVPHRPKPGVKSAKSSPAIAPYFRRATMTELAETAPAQAPLTETQRCVDVFAAPSKTFIDLRRKATFWGPLIVMIIVGIGFSFTVQKQIGWEQVFLNNMRQTPAAMQKIESAPNAASMEAAYVKGTAIFSYVFSAVILLFTLISALLVWVTVNFGFGGTAKYSQIYAVSLYAGLVVNIKYLLGIIAIFAGLAPDSFLAQNPVGSNIGYYLSTDLPLWLRTFCAHLDIFEIWWVVLSVIGVSLVARITKGKAAVAVVGWWIMLILLHTAVAAAQG
jgi:hypothetical protein